MPAFVDRILGRIHDARQDHPVLDRVFRTQEHYGRVGAGQQAGAITYFGFLSVFPILALSFFAVGYIAKVYEGAQDNLITAINTVLPGLIGTENGHGQVTLKQVQDAANTVGLAGGLGVLYAGLGWLSSLRRALQVVFEVPRIERPNFVIGKIRDLLSLILLGIILFVTVALASLVSGFSNDVLDYLNLSTDLGWLVEVLAVVIGLAANALLFYTMFVLLARPSTPRPALWAGAFLGGVGFEILKYLSSYLLRISRGTPAFQVFGITLILLVWINYFSQVILYAAAFAQVSPATREAGAASYASPPVQGPPSPPLEETEAEANPPPAPARRVGAIAAFLAGAGSMVGVLAVLRKIGRSGK